MSTKTDFGFRVYEDGKEVEENQLLAKEGDRFGSKDRRTGRRKGTNGESIAKQLCTRHEGRLVRTRSLIDHLAILDLWDDRMANRQHPHELSPHLARAVFLLPRAQLPPQLLKVLLPANVVPVRPSLPSLSVFDDISVLDTGDRALAELHLVAGEGAGLVREDILDLAKLFDEGRGSAESRSIGFGVVPVA
jgi:hypothetical protein